MQENKMICYCAGITYEAIEQAYKEGNKSLESIQRATGAGIICGRCTSSIEKAIKDINEEN